MQSNRPRAFGSKMLTVCQSRYSNIEQEMLDFAYGMQWYHTYQYGNVRDFKPLVTIWKKPPHAASPRLQLTLIKAWSDNYQIVYRPGTQMVPVATLNRLPNPETMGTHKWAQHTIAIINISSPRSRMPSAGKPRKASNWTALKEVIHQGWPDNLLKRPNDRSHPETSTCRPPRQQEDSSSCE